MTAPASVIELVERFATHNHEYQQHKNETELRREFLDPFFKALGWDVFNDKGLSERFKEVVHEASVEVEGQAKAADYAFKAAEKIIFFVEAKKPSVRIETHPEPAFQIRRYGWSAKLPISILTDFEQLAIYDCRSKPDKTDKAAQGRIHIYHYAEYVEKWDEIAAIFSREAVLNGSFEQFVERNKDKKATTEVDDDFLAEIERWRELLARNLARNNPSIRNERELNYAVQMTIDRIIFLRICEDRGVERFGQIRDITDSSSPKSDALQSDLPLRDASRGEVAEGRRGQVYAGLLQLFKQADARYNSGLFHFSEEKGQSSSADTLTQTLRIDDDVLQDMVRNLYYPDSPYAFSYISADILGQVYERFLGKVVRLTADHTDVEVSEKPEVRKAGGVYYTPVYIVDYIVKNTVGKLFGDPNPSPGPSPDGRTPSGEGGKTPREVALIKVLDPACGSGSFLLGAYQYLLDWYLKVYSANPQQWAKNKNPVIYQRMGGGWELTTAEKKRILLAHIHGVDIDAQAVEVTKLSLLLKVLEGESEQTIGSQLSLLRERVLPDLGRNIQCGNSLIGPDYYEGHQLGLGGGVFDEEEQYRVNAFNWQQAFPQVFTAGGFDAVIGNPPYIRIQSLQETSPIDVGFYKKHYKSAGKGNYDIYVIFIEKGLSLLNEKGRLGYILPHKFFNAQYGEPVRSLIANGKHLSKVVHFGDQQIFENATTYTCLMFLDKTGHDEFEFEKIAHLASWRVSQSQTSEVLKTSDVLVGKINASTVTESEWNFSVGESAGLFEKLARMPLKLGEIAEKMAQGIRTSANEIYVVDSRSENDSVSIVYSKQLDKNVTVENEILSSFLQGREIKRYRILSSGKKVIVPYYLENGRATFITVDQMNGLASVYWTGLMSKRPFKINGAEIAQR